MWLVYEADGTVNSAWVSEKAARALANKHPGWTYGYVDAYEWLR